MNLLIIESGKKIRIRAEQGSNLLQQLRQDDFTITAPCAGRGTCLKCSVDIEGIGSVLACQTRLEPALWEKAGLELDQDLVIRLPELARPQVATNGLLPELVSSPLITKDNLQLPRPDLSDQRPDEQRLAEESGCLVPFSLLAGLPGLMREKDFKLSWFSRTDTRTIQRFVDDNDPGPLGLAVDIGTTTMAAYLCTLANGRLLASAALLNPQRAYGADVISRIEEAAAGRQEQMQKELVRAIGELADMLLDKAGKLNKISYTRSAIAHAVLAGNTVMMHFLAGLPADNIARTPFIPASVSALTLTAKELGLPFLPDTVCQLLPSIAGYVGADVTAGIITTGLAKKEKALLLDIGTNGEIVLAYDGRLIACSTAAGPAFEAANISCGMGGVAGAIDDVSLENDDLKISVIGNSTGPAGICGSGLVSAIAAFLEAGVIDETGRITDEPEELAPGLAGRLANCDGQPCIILAENSRGKPVYLSQKDIRELQNAKAALAAGILFLLEQAGLAAEDITEVFIAGGFGNYLAVEDALAIGLLPEGFAGRTSSAGNTAGMGALACLLQQELFQEAVSLSRQVVYYELSAQKRFTDLYIEAMLFPEK